MSAAEWSAIELSILISLAAVLLILPIGVALGWLLARREFFGKALVETVVNLPLVIPPVVTGYLLLKLLGRQGVVGQWMDAWFGVRFVFDWKGAAVASAVMAFPLLVRAVRISIEAVDEDLESAARTCGAGQWDTFCSITLPLAWHGVVAGCVLAFARSMGEFGATIMIAGNIPGETRTIPLYIYTQLEKPGGIEQSTSIVLFSIVIAGAAVFLGEVLTRNNRRRLTG